MTNTREEVAVAEAIAKEMLIAHGSTSIQTMREAAKAAIAASNSKYVAGLVEALKRIAYHPLGGDTATYFCGVHMQNMAKEALNNLPEELRG